MSALRILRNFWIPWVTAMVLACFSNAVAQARYKVQDLGVQHPDNLGMAMGLNNYGWTLNMEQLLDYSAISTLFPAVQGTVRFSIGEFNLPLGTLGGKNSSINWNGINDRGESVGMSETSVSDPNGDGCRRHRYASENHYARGKCWQAAFAEIRTLLNPR